VLNETQFSGISSGVFHGSMNLFAEDGTLLAIASQTGLPPRLKNANEQVHAPEHRRRLDS
jgi:acyl-CoA thioesterase